MVVNSLVLILTCAIFVFNRPMSLSLIKQNIEKNVIKSTEEFTRDMMLMCVNAIMYNNHEYDVYSMAQEMYDEVMRAIEVYLVCLPVCLPVYLSTEQSAYQRVPVFVRSYMCPSAYICVRPLLSVCTCLRLFMYALVVFSFSSSVHLCLCLSTYVLVCLLISVRYLYLSDYGHCCVCLEACVI